MRLLVLATPIIITQYIDLNCLPFGGMFNTVYACSGPPAWNLKSSQTVPYHDVVFSKQALLHLRRVAGDDLSDVRPASCF